MLVRVVGKHCESGDVVVRADYLPADAGRGDLLAVPATGAYHHSLANNYNLLTRPPVVAVNEGDDRVLIARETLADLLRPRRGPRRGKAADDPGRAPDPRRRARRRHGRRRGGAPAAHPRGELEARVGAPLVLAGVAVRDLEATRSPALPKELLTTDAESLVLGAHIVVELIGGVERARELVLLALESGADVVTGNKALLATHGSELFEAAERVGAQLNYEAAVGGAIPIIRPLRDSLAGDDVRRILGIVNGTTNFVLDRMDEHGDTFEEALAEATRLGYAEADPTGDVERRRRGAEGRDPRRASPSTPPCRSTRSRRGHRADHARAGARAPARPATSSSCSRSASGSPSPDGTEGVSARVHPALLPRTHPLASVRGANNAVFVEAEAAGDLMFYGAGAGGIETASAVLGDLVSAARRHVIGGPGVAAPPSPACRCSIPAWYDAGTRSADGAGRAGRARAARGHRRGAGRLDRDGPAVEMPATGGTATLVIGTHRAPEAALVGRRDGPGRCARGRGRGRRAPHRRRRKRTDGS